MGSPKKIEDHPFPLYNRFDFKGRPLDYQFLKNAECRIMQQNHPSSSSSSSSPPIFNNLSCTLSKKTIDEVWNGSPAEIRNTVDITLEEFIMHHQDGFIQNPVPFMQKIDRWQQQAIVEPKFSEMMELGYLDEQLKMTDKSSDSQARIENKNGFTDERMAKTIERRQRRMIKNRESAARSRARKQAYTNQLQHALLQLQTTNSLLKKRKEVELHDNIDSSSRSGRSYQLRRTSSCSF